MVNEGISDCKKPQFFKPFLPDSYQQLEIPKTFIKHIDREMCKDKYWVVKLKDFCFEEGWSDFVQDHNLCLEDLVVFNHEGGLVFDVMVFGHSACEKNKYPAIENKGEEDEMEVQDDSRGKEKEIKGSIPMSRDALYSNRKNASSHSNRQIVAKSQDPSEDSMRQFAIKNPLMT
ncbi:hypothetical protein NE237_020250 [Protea cynaroides]|uniref:TF-B3 domain-containing protein n=1 Tax=Protea cynaroides TaxID=273540 RepID=A0A9Q0H923_9MAGN|nr:hypothetical protein NE237_020250 [Protea cynaroides]